jgi:hypothetical protein
MRRLSHLMRRLESAMGRLGHRMHPLELLKERAKTIEPLRARETGKNEEDRIHQRYPVPNHSLGTTELSELTTMEKLTSFLLRTVS